MRYTDRAIALLFLLTFAHAAFGQTGGVITGVVSDPAGAVLSERSDRSEELRYRRRRLGRDQRHRQLRPRRSSRRHV